MTQPSPTISGSAEVLQGLVGRFGPAVLNDRRRVLGTLADHAPDDRREMHLLAAALDDGLPARFASGPPGPADIERESQRLTESRGLSPELARWAVSALAQALGAPAGPPAPIAPAAPAQSGTETATPPPRDTAHTVTAAVTATPPHKHARFWRFVRIGGPIIVIIFGVLRFLASLPS